MDTLQHILNGFTVAAQPINLWYTFIGCFINDNTLELYMALIFGVVGYVFRKIDIPLAPMVLSLVLGGIMEQSFRQAMTISSANPVIFVSSGICVTLLVLAVILVLLPVILPRLAAWKQGPEDSES